MNSYETIVHRQWCINEAKEMVDASSAFHIPIDEYWKKIEEIADKLDAFIKRPLLPAKVTDSRITMTQPVLTSGISTNKITNQTITTGQDDIVVSPREDGSVEISVNGVIKMVCKGSVRVTGSVKYPYGL